MKDFRNPANWKRTSKKLYNVYMCRPEFGTAVHNRLEHCDYTTNEKKQFVLSGTVGEQWVIDGNKLASTYEFEDGTPINPQTLGAKIAKGTNGQIDWIKLRTRQSTGQFNYAFHLPINEIRDFPVKTSWGETLYANKGNEGHGTGDFLVCATNPDGSPNLNDMWVVNGNVFATTYDMRPFPGIASKEALEHETEKPSVSLVTYTGHTVNTEEKRELTKAERFIKDIEKNLFEKASLYNDTLQEANFKIMNIDLNKDTARIDFKCDKEPYKSKLGAFIEVVGYNATVSIKANVPETKEVIYNKEKRYDITKIIDDFIPASIYSYGDEALHIKEDPVNDSLWTLKDCICEAIKELDKKESKGKNPEEIVKYISSKLTLGGYRVDKINEDEGYLWEIDYPAAVDNTSIVIQFIDWEITSKIKDIGITLVVDADEYFSKEININELDEAINEINKGLQVYASLVNAYNSKTPAQPQVSEKTQRIQKSQGTISGVMRMFNRNKL